MPLFSFIVKLVVLHGIIRVNMRKNSYSIPWYIGYPTQKIIIQFDPVVSISEFKQTNNLIIILINLHCCLKNTNFCIRCIKYRSFTSKRYLKIINPLQILVVII